MAGQMKYFGVFAVKPLPTSLGAFNSKFAKLLSSRWTAAVVLILAIIQQAVGHQNTDNSWLFTVAEHVLGGARPYVDIIETNPPASFLIYLPAAIIAQALGAPIEAIAVAFVVLSAILCAWLAWRILLDAGVVEAPETGFVAVAASFTLLVLPGFAFAQREHLAVIWILPVLAVYAARLSGVRPDWWKALAAGVLAGFVICIKPHFVLALALPLSGCMIARRSFKLAFTVENLAAAMVMLSFAAVTFCFFPAYFDTMRVMLDAYVPLKEPLSSLLRQRWLVLNIGLLAIAGHVGRGACFTPRAFTFIAASLGFLISYFVQGKGWANHALPGLTLCYLTLALLFAPAVAQAANGEAPSAQGAALPIGFLYIIIPFFLIAPGVFGASYDWSGEEEHPGLIAAVGRYAPPHPRLIALSPDQSVGHPLVRRVGGVWCGRTNDLMIMIYSRMLIGAKRGDADYRHRLELYASNEASAFLADVQKNRPDAILVDKDQRISEAITAFPDLASALKDYEPVATVDEIVVWTRRAKS